MPLRRVNTLLCHFLQNSSPSSQRAWIHMHKLFRNYRMQNLPEGFLNIGRFNVFAWSLSGIETTVVVKQPDDGFSCTFDMGYACRSSVKSDHVLISHGHMDHITAIPQHCRKRELMGIKPSKYYMLPHLVQPSEEIYQNFLDMNENAEGKARPEFVAVDHGETIKLQKDYHAVSFPTVHRVKSQGYIVYKTLRKLKEELKGLPSHEIGAIKQKGGEIHDIIVSPEIAYTGDTTFEVFTNGLANPDLFRVNLLIVEATYINNGETYEECVNTARRYGHIDLIEFFQNSELFQNVDNILLIHFSDKYSSHHVQQSIESLPDSIRHKVFVATLAKDRYL